MNKSIMASALVSLCLVGGCDSRPTTRGETNNREMPLTEDLTRAPTEPPDVDPAANPLAQQGGPGAVNTPASAGPQPAAPARLTDEQIVHITELVDRGELEQATVATERASDAQVKRFAAHMLAQHTKSKELGKQLARTENLAPTASLTAQKLSDDANRTLDGLRHADDASFDAKYMEAQVNQHELVKGLLDGTLIPGAASPELKARLEETRGMVESHLQEARKIRDGLASADAPSK
jgi:putative membrane protein